MNFITEISLSGVRATCRNASVDLTAVFSRSYVGLHCTTPRQKPAGREGTQSHSSQLSDDQAAFPRRNPCFQFSAIHTLPSCRQNRQTT